MSTPNDNNLRAYARRWGSQRHRFFRAYQDYKREGLTELGLLARPWKLPRQIR